MRYLPTRPLLAFALLAACDGQIVEFPLETPTESSEVTPTATPGATPTATPGGTPTATPDGTPTPTAGGTPTATGDGTPTPTGEGTPTSTPGATPSSTGTPGDTPSATQGPPTIIVTTPEDEATEVSINIRPTATFSKTMDGGTLNSETFTLRQGLISVPGEVRFDSATDTATFSPDEPLLLEQSYTATVSVGAQDLGGLALESPYSWTFSTAACGQTPIDLGSAADFAVLSGAGITSTGPTYVEGDLGVSPGTSITGFPPGIVVGAQHAGDPASAQGIADLTVAYNQASLRVLCPVTVAGNIGGQTLPPGLYKSTSSLEISSGDLTLDAQGEADAVFIFQVASTLTVTPGRQVILSGNAQASNIYWQVGTSATLGTTSSFQGTIMADQAISLETGALITGRLLARIAAVTLDDNDVLSPLP